MSVYSKRLFYTMFLLSSLLYGCQKDIGETSSSGEIMSDDVSLHKGGNIRLVTADSEYGLDEFDYYEEGLLKNWLFAGTTYTYEYDSRGRITKALYYEGTLLSAIFTVFYNDRGQINRVVQYEGSTDEILDEIFFTYNHKGDGIRLESFMQDYYAIHTYNNQGNLVEWTFFLGGAILYKGEWTYDHKMKSPYSAIQGLPFAFQYINGFFYANKHYSTSESLTIYDENGAVSEYYPQDPSKTIVEAGPKNYVAKSDFWDVTSESYVHFVFTYEKGKKGNEISKNAKRRAIQNLIRSNGKGSMKKQVEDYRRSHN